MRGSPLLKSSSNLPSLAWSLVVAMWLPITPSWKLMLTSERIFTPTLSFLVAPLCNQVLPIVCKKKSLLWLHLPSRSRSLLLLRGNTLSELVAPYCLPYLLSNECGSPSKNTMNVVHPLFTKNASNYDTQIMSSRIYLFLSSQIQQYHWLSRRSLDKTNIRKLYSEYIQAQFSYVFKGQLKPKWFYKDIISPKNK